MIEAATTTWERMVRKPDPVYLLQMAEAFKVETDAGVMGGEAGGYLAYDPDSGHLWPVKASYIAQHYVKFPGNATVAGLTWR